MNLWTWLVDTAGLLVALGALDWAHVRALRWSPARDAALRFFLLHVEANAAITWLAWPDARATAVDPAASVQSPFTHWPLKIALALHLYHFKDYATLSPVDWAHHLSVLALTGLTLSAHHYTGPLCNFCLFFICGLPGGIDYALLVGRKWGWVPRLQEKRINAYLHMWIRAPGLIAYAAIAIICTPQTSNPLRGITLSFFTLPVVFNALYFAHRVVENYGYSLANDWRARGRHRCA